jgi:hypothetical protein
MRLKVSYASNVPGANKVWYYAAPDIPYPDQNVEDTKQHLERLASRIALVGKNALGDDFGQVNTKMFPGAIGLYVTKGLASGPKKFDFRSFLGWIEIFDTETGLATRAAIPRAN